MALATSEKYFALALPDELPFTSACASGASFGKTNVVLARLENVPARMWRTRSTKFAGSLSPSTATASAARATAAAHAAAAPGQGLRPPARHRRRARQG